MIVPQPVLLQFSYNKTRRVAQSLLQVKDRIIKNKLNNKQIHILRDSSSTIPGQIRIWKCWFLMREENQSTQGKYSRSEGENQQPNSFHIVYVFLSLRVRVFHYVHSPSHQKLCQYYSWLLSPNHLKYDNDALKKGFLLFVIDHP